MIAPEAEPVARDGAMPDELDVLSKKLAIAKEVRVAFGTKAARRAWAMLGLLPELTAEMPERPGFAPVGVVAHLHRSLAAWLEERTVAEPGWRVETQTLYADYIAWVRPRSPRTIS